MYLCVCMNVLLNVLLWTVVFAHYPFSCPVCVSCKSGLAFSRSQECSFLYQKRLCILLSKLHLSGRTHLLTFYYTLICTQCQKRKETVFSRPQLSRVCQSSCISFSWLQNADSLAVQTKFDMQRETFMHRWCSQYTFANIKLAVVVIAVNGGRAVLCNGGPIFLRV